MMRVVDHSISERLESPAIRLISLGAGVQSSVMALLATRGELGDVPDAAIFADTQWEPASVYEHLDWLESQLSFPVYRVSIGSIRETIRLGTKTDGRFVAVPWYTSDGGMGRRQCSREFKIAPLQQKARELMGIRKHERANGRVAEMWIGITTDEVQRLRESGNTYTHNRWPLLELRWSRNDCLTWFSSNYPGRELSKSACIGCPYHNNAYWSQMKSANGDEWKDAVDVDKLIRSSGTMRGMNAQSFMHRSLVPLDEVTFVDEGQGLLFENGFVNECDGVCGL